MLCVLMNASPSSPSPALLRANQRLYALRQQAQSHKTASDQETAKRPFLTVPPWQEAEPTDAPLTTAEAVLKLPAHLGWDSTAVTAAIRTAAKKQETAPVDKPLRAGHPSFCAIRHRSHPGGQPLAVYEPDTSHTARQLRLQLDGDTVKHYPSLGIAALQAEAATTYRLWLLCRYLDIDGRGWLPISEIRQQFTGTDARLKLCTWRRLRQLLGQGQGQFWQWDKVRQRLWLFGTARTAVHLNLPRLTGKPVALPIKAITQNIGDFKAHLYAAWHSGRKVNNPISREVQQNLTGIPERSQRHYCRVAKLNRQTNIAIGNKKNPEEVQKQAWQRGRALFEFTDHQGWQGRKGVSYTAWQLPNSYTGPHQQAPKGRMRKINRKLKDLVNQEAQGNGGEKIEKRYFANGKTAVRGLKKQRGEVYWPMMSVSRQSQLWVVFSLA